MSGVLEVGAPDPAVVDRLYALLARYVAEFGLLSSRRGEPSTLEVDAAFAALRLQQRVRWPAAGAAVDELGCRAHDVLHAAAASGWTSSRTNAALELHAAAVSRLDELLARPLRKTGREPLLEAA